MIIIEKYIEVIHNIIPLLSTIEDALNHIKKQLSELRYEEALGLLEDSMLGIASIEEAVEPMPQISKGKISELTKDLKYSIMKVLENYEKGQQDLIEKQLETEVIPIFKNWKQEIENTLKPYILS